MKCATIRRNPEHVCKSPLKTYAVKRAVDNCYGHLTICEDEMVKLLKAGHFRFDQEAAAAAADVQQEGK